MRKQGNVWTIVRKEFARFFGDRALLFTAVIMPGLLIYIVYSLMGENIGKSHQDDNAGPTTVYVDNLPESLRGDFDSIPFQLVTEGFNAVALIGDSLADKEKNLIYVNFPPHFDSLIAAYDPMGGEMAPNVKIYHNSNSDNSELAYQTVKTYLEDWENSRNNMFDINANAESPDAEETFDMADEDDSLGEILGQLFPMLLMMLLFSGCMAVAPTAIAGEKERGTIATLLVTPMRRSELAIGKILSLSTFAMLSGLSSFLGIILSLPRMLNGDGVDIDFAIPYTTSDYLLILCVLISTVLVMVSCISILSALAKDVKSAGTLVLPLMLLVMFVGFTPMLGGDAPEALTAYLIPFYNSVQSMASVFSFNINPAAIGITVVANIAYTAIAVFVLTRMFNSEKVMFGK
ncbi:MAG: ABC transporter permease [Bacteroidales bacterium]|nr:ABC transporter permease [Bacteroidales bacterium]MBR6330187.1 ABC transporter permease [Bacteroidales bacterium]